MTGNTLLPKQKRSRTGDGSEVSTLKDTAALVHKKLKKTQKHSGRVSHSATTDIPTTPTTTPTTSAPTLEQELWIVQVPSTVDLRKWDGLRLGTLLSQHELSWLELPQASAMDWGVPLLPIRGSVDAGDPSSRVESVGKLQSWHAKKQKVRTFACCQETMEPAAEMESTTSAQTVRTSRVPAQPEEHLLGYRVKPFGATQ